MPEEGLPCGLHRIERLMRANGLRARPRRRGSPKDGGARSVVAGNPLDRDSRAGGPNQERSAGFTRVRTAEGRLHVAAVPDLFSRRAVGWSVKAERDDSLVTEAPTMAARRRGKAGALLHRSGQGGQRTSDQSRRLPADHGVARSTSRAGNVRDDAATGSFFSSLETERTARKVHHGRDAARSDAFDRVERFRNPKRRHPKLGHLSPMRFEERSVLL